MTTIFFAGGEVETLTRALLDNGCENILYSYFYVLTMRRERFIARMQSEYPKVRWFLDSGAFTYYIKHQTSPASLPPYRQFVERYFQYIDEYGLPYCRITEPDFDNTLPDITEFMVDQWREEMLERWPHLNVMPVWHGWRGVDAWNKYVMDPRIRALAIGRGTNYLGDGGYRRMLMEARKMGKPVHGFAMTRINTMLRRVPFDSVDSTSWVMGQKYGTLYVFRDNRFLVLPADQKDKRKLYRNYFKAIGCDPKLILADDVSEVRKANVIAWRNMAGRMEEMRKRQGMTVMEKPEEILIAKTQRQDTARPSGLERDEVGVVDMYGNPKEREPQTARVAYPKERE